MIVSKIKQTKADILLSFWTISSKQIILLISKVIFIVRKVLSYSFFYEAFFENCKLFLSRKFTSLRLRHLSATYLSKKMAPCIVRMKHYLKKQLEDACRRIHRLYSCIILNRAKLWRKSIASGKDSSDKKVIKNAMENFPTEEHLKKKKKCLKNHQYPSNFHVLLSPKVHIPRRRHFSAYQS